MAEFTPSKKQASDFNNGVQYVNGDVVKPSTVNNLVESALYSQQESDNAKTVAESAMDLVDSVVTNAYAPPLVGMHHLQFSGEPTPAEIWGGTAWVIDTDYQGKTIIGSGGEYILGFTGGEENHTQTIEEMPNHRHIVGYSTGSNQNEGYPRVAEKSYNGHYEDLTSFEGFGNPFNIMQPYKVVNIWKRTA